jgi:hypothetical protein
MKTVQSSLYGNGDLKVADPSFKILVRSEVAEYDAKLIKEKFGAELDYEQKYKGLPDFFWAGP